MDELQPLATETVAFTPAEIDGLRAALADVETRGTVAFEDAIAWLDSLETGNPLPMPEPQKP